MAKFLMIFRPKSCLIGFQPAEGGNAVSARDGRRRTYIYDEMEENRLTTRRLEPVSYTHLDVYKRQV